MTSDHEDPPIDARALVQGGPSYLLSQRLGMSRSDAPHRLLKVALLLFLTWVPLALWSLISGNAFGHGVDIAFVREPEVHARFLFVVPLLELAEVVVAVSLAVQTKHLFEMGVVPEKERARFRHAQEQAIGLRNSWIPEGVV